MNNTCLSWEKNRKDFYKKINKKTQNSRKESTTWDVTKIKTWTERG